MPSLGRRKTLLAGALTLFTLSGASLVHLAGGPGGFAELIEEADEHIPLAMLVLLAAEALKGVRLVVFSAGNGERVSLHWAVVGRLVGKFFGVLTPAYSGANPARAAVIASTSKMEPGSALGLTTLESLFDTLLPVGVTLVLSTPLLPETWLPFLASLFIGVVWIGGIAWAKTERFMGLIESRLGGGSYTCYLARQRDMFFKSLSSVLHSKRISLGGALLTVTAHLVEAYAIIVVSWSLAGSAGALGSEHLLKAFLALEVSNVMVMSPTPGGALFFEYGLTGVLPPTLIVWWRVTYILFSLMPGLLIFLLVGRVREYAESVARYESLECR